MTTKPIVQEISEQEIEALIQRVEHAIEHELSISVEDMRCLLLAIKTLLNVHNELDKQRTTLFKLCQLLGMVRSSERRTSPTQEKKLDENDDGTACSDDASKADHKSTSKATDRSGKNPKKKRIPPSKKQADQTIYHRITDLKKGSVCPYCQHGRLRKLAPQNLLRITAQSPYCSTRHVMERLRCNSCDERFSPTLPEAVLKDGGLSQMYGYSARSLMGILKCFSGVPYHHQEKLSTILGCSINDATILDQCQYLANDLMPVFNELKRYAAQATRFLIDDTHHKILDATPEVRPNRKGTGTQIRTGIYASGLIALTEAFHEIVLFEISLGHAGEHLDQILSHRAAGLAPPILMSDALSANKPTQTDVQISYCNAHARRKFLELELHEPIIKDWVIPYYRKIWLNDAEVKKNKLDEKARLEYHQQHSLPIMTSLRAWCEQHMASQSAELNDKLTDAVKYFLKHFEGLCLFCHIPGALIDNNRMEETLKMIIRSRKQSFFHKNESGANNYNVIASVIATAHRAGLNIFKYLTALQQEKTALSASVQDFLPWNFKT